MAEVMALAGALWFICFGAALGGRYGVIGCLLGGVAGAVLGLFSGYAFGLFGEYLIMWLDRLAEKRRVLGTVVRLIVFIVMVYLLGLFFVWSSRIVFQSLKERIRRQRTDTALIALVTMRSSSGTDRDGRSAANRSATALARSSGDTERRYLDGALYGQGKSVAA